MSVMESTPETSSTDAISDGIRTILDRQKKAHIDEGPASVKRRKDWIDRSIALLVDNKIGRASCRERV